MTTKVGLQADFIAALKDIISLDYDAVEAYEATINRLENEEHKKILESFKKDHQRHIEELSAFLKKRNDTSPTGASLKSLLTQGKVLLANMIGDKMILRAMRSNEIDTNTAYGRINNDDDIPEEIRDTLRHDLQDEKKHLSWIEKTLDNDKYMEEAT